VFVGIQHDAQPSDGTLYLAQSGGRCVLVVEVVSPNKRDNDAVTKVGHYHTAGVPLYVLIDQKKEGGPRSLLAYRWTPQRYQEAPLDPQGRLLIPELGLFLSVRDDRTVCHDAMTGLELGDYSRLARELVEARRALEEADRRNQEQEQALEDTIEKLHEESQSRAKEERACRQAVLAREQAEREREQAEKALQNAERERIQADQARADAERQTREANQALADAEQRARDLEALVARLQGGASPP
jgi:hypothetical protein